MNITVIEWEDTTKLTNDSNFDLNKDPDSRMTIIKTVGFQYQETKKTILLAQELWTNEKTPRDWIVIPKAQIIKKEELPYEPDE
jgi:hypothetical protein